MLHFCSGLPIILVGCKKDLRNDPKTIDELRRVNQRPVTEQEVSSTPISCLAHADFVCSADREWMLQGRFRRTSTLNALPNRTFAVSLYVSSVDDLVQQPRCQGSLRCCNAGSSYRRQEEAQGQGLRHPLDVSKWEGLFARILMGLEAYTCTWAHRGDFLHLLYLFNLSRILCLVICIVRDFPFRIEVICSTCRADYTALNG